MTDDKKDTKELAAVHDTPPETPPTTEPETMALTPEQRKEVLAIANEVVRTAVDIASIEALVRRIETRADQMQTIFASDQVARGKLEQAYKDVRQDYKQLEKRMDDSDEERRKIQHALDSMREMVRDGHYKLGNALIPVQGRNPMVDDASLVMTPLRDELRIIREKDIATVATHVQSVKTELDKVWSSIQVNAAYMAQQQADKEAREKWRKEAIPVLVRGAASVMSSPFVINNAIKILGGGAIATAFIEVLKILAGGK